MERRGFIKRVGLSTAGVMIGSSLFASVFKRKQFELIEIDFPRIHVRHGFYNLQGSSDKGLQIQRDVFNENGLEQISENRMVSVKVSDSGKENFGILDKEEFKSKSNKLSALKLKANELIYVNVDAPCLIFSEIGTLIISGKVVNSNQAISLTSKKGVALNSEVNQSVFIYKL